MNDEHGQLPWWEDSEVLDGLEKCDPRAQRKVHAQEHAPGIIYANSITHDRGRAEDAYNRALYKFFRRCESKGTPRRKPRAFLYKCIKNAAFDELERAHPPTAKKPEASGDSDARDQKRRLRMQSLDAAVAQQVVDHRQPEYAGQSVDRDVCIAAIRRAVSRLPRQQRRCLKAHRFTGLPLAEIAKRLNRELSTVKENVKEAWKKLKADPFLSSCFELYYTRAQGKPLSAKPPPEK